MSVSTDGKSVEVPLTWIRAEIDMLRDLLEKPDCTEGKAQSLRGQLAAWRKVERAQFHPHGRAPMPAREITADVPMY
jgi:hypothetical protein